MKRKKDIAEEKESRKKPVWLAAGGLALFPPLKDDLRADVCIVGAGMAGMTCAYLLAKDGKSVVVLEAETVGGGETCRTTAHLSNAMDGGYREIERLHGTEGARLVAQSHTAAIGRIEGIAVENGIDCDFERLDGYLFCAPGGSPAALNREYDAALRAGVPDVGLVKRAPLEFHTGQAIRFGMQGQFHPLKYLNGLVQEVRGMGGRIFGKTRAAVVKGGNKAHVITTDGTKVFCGAVVVATDTPFNDRLVIHTKQSAYRTYAIAARVRSGAVPRALYWDEPASEHEGYHYVRIQSSKRGYDTLIVGGEDHKTGQSNDAVDRYTRLETWAREHFPMMESVESRWSGQVMEPVDGLAYIGRNPMDEPNVYVTTGASGMGMTYGNIAGTLITDLICGRRNEWEKVYDPSRVTLGAIRNFARENSNVLLQYRHWFTAGQVATVDQIPPKRGAVIRDGFDKFAVYRDENNLVHTRSAVCPHLGGIVSWNASEKSWDCPCHGSRFDPYGKVIHGPASQDLAPASLPQTSTHEPPMSGAHRHKRL